MAPNIEDYALIGDCHSAALVGRDGSIDWFCAPRFDSPACFAALLGNAENGRWLIAPCDAPTKTTRQYRGESLVLETVFETQNGTVALIDFMPFGLQFESPQIVRIVEGRRGRVPMRMEWVVRFGYGSIVPWVTQQMGTVSATAGPDTLHLHTEVPLYGRELRTFAEFDISEGGRVPFHLTYNASHLGESPPIATAYALERTQAAWSAWSSRSRYHGPERNAVQRSLLVLKALTFDPTGGIVAAPTTSLPERIGGERNWDYRFCWVRDATVTLYALLRAGYTEEAQAWREWLLRAVAGSPSQIQVIYGLAGERHLPERELAWLSGFAGSAPVRVGNAAHGQLQLDVFGELMDAMHQCRQAQLESGASWALERSLLGFLETRWREPDESIWEVRGPARQFTYSKVMAWVAFDRAIKAIELFGLEGPLSHWQSIRAEIHAEVCAHAFSTQRNAFMQAYDLDELDASLLQIPLVGFLPADDPRVRGTLAAIERELKIDDTFVLRYKSRERTDGLPAGEGAFLACSFWLVNNLVMQGRRQEADALFQRLLAVQNDVGLMAEEYDPLQRRQLGNFPQAFSHLALIDAALALSEDAAQDVPHRVQHAVHTDACRIGRAPAGGDEPASSS
jgi:GH15 family glucan-1,4-alpha-glucosidase